MRTITRLCIALIATLAPSVLDAQSTVTAFVNANVIPMDRERVLADQTVVVRDGRIAALGDAASTPVPDGATRIDARGKYLIPGLAEMHAHIPPPPATPPGDFDWDAFNRNTENVLFLYVAAGITTVRGMLGHPSHLPLRERVERGELVGPRIWTSGPSVNGNSVQTVERAREVPAEQKAAGFDFIKIHPGLQRDVFDALVAAAHEAGIGFAGHVPTAVGVERALEARYLSIDHLDGYMHLLVRDGAPVDLNSPGGWFGVEFMDHVDDSRIPDVARATREAGVWNVPTQVLMENFVSTTPPESLAARPEMRFVPQQTLTQWLNSSREIRSQPWYSPDRVERYTTTRRRLIKALHDAGAGLVLGSDAPQFWNVPGYAALRELETYTAAGLTPYQALETGTVNVARYFDVLDRAGTLEVGKQADMILLDANPLDDIRNVWQQSGVMIRGSWLPKAELDQRLGDIAARMGH